MEPTEIAIAVVEHAGTYLVGKRPGGVPLAGMSEFPGGKVRVNESPAQAAVRECLEETGLSVHVRDTLAKIVHEYTHGRVRLHFFICTPVDANQPPAEPFSWVPADQLCQHEFPPANDQIIRRLKDGHRGSVH